jgi:putative sigma-54 modulation protein
VQIKISARHGHLSADHQKHIHDKAEKLLHYFDRISMIEVTVDVPEHGLKKVEFLVNAEHKHDLVAHESNADLFTALDLALDKIKQQIHKYKEKIQDHRRDASLSDATAVKK